MAPRSVSSLLKALALATAVTAAPQQVPHKSTTKYFINFGDSYSQTGFNYTLAWPSAADPIGNPALPGYTASGGLNWVGFLASVLNTSLTLTFNFAYGGATTSAALVTPYEPTVLSFVDQVGEFNASIAKHPAGAPWTSENSLFGVWIGVNDVGNSWYEANETQRLNEIMDVYFDQLKVLHSTGARNFVLLSVPPITKTPLVLNTTVADQEAEAACIVQYNDLLAHRLQDFTARNPGTVGKVVNTSIAFYKAIDDPEAYGAPNATCWNSDGTSCLWFNNYHPGIAINKLVAEEVAAAWKGSFF